MPVIYLSVAQCLMLETAFLRCGRPAAESCNPTRQLCVRLVTLVSEGLSGKQIALGALECQGGQFKFPLPMKATDIRKGHVLMIDGQPCRVMDFTHRTPGNLRAFVQVRFRNLVSGNTFDQRLAATEFLNEARLDTKEMQVLYQDQGGVHVMDQQTYEQFTLDERAVGEDTPWLQPEMVVQVEWLDGRPIAIELPAVIELKVVETSPVMRTATKTASTKPAKLSNGVTVQVPEFISPGEKVRVDPRSGQYLERAK